MRCRSFTTDISDTRSPGLVADGTRCGNQSVSLFRLYVFILIINLNSLALRVSAVHRDC